MKKERYVSPCFFVVSLNIDTSFCYKASGVTGGEVGALPDLDGNNKETENP